MITGTPMALADGAWTVTATNSGGATSASLAIHVVAPPPPVVTTQPAPAAVYQGQVATFTVAASGVWLSYQWRVDGADVPGATAPSYSTPPLEISEDGARYDVVVHDPFGGATTSAPAAVAVKTGTFSSVGAMQSEHAYHTATRLADGRVLIAGGEAETWRPSAFAELYDPDTGTFSTTGAMQVARLRHSATLLHTGEVLIAGGFTPTGVTTTAELYDPAAGTFRFTGSMAVFRDRHTATLLPDGTVLVAGGRSRGDFDFPVTQVTTSGAEVYDPSTGQFTSVHPMTCARAQHTATLLANGDVLIAGGYVEKVGDEAGTIGPVVWVFSAGLERYSPSMGTFARVGESWSRHGHTATQGAGGSVLLAGGFCGAPSATDWSRQATTPAAELFDGGAGTALAVARMAGSRTYHTATVLPGGSVLVAGGIWVPERQDPAARQGPIGLDTAELFEPATGVFSGTGSMTRPRSGHAATLLPDGGVLVTGGASGSRAAEVFR